MAGDDEEMGPISYLIVEFPGNKMTGDGFTELVDLVDRGLIRILDLRFVSCRDDGSVAAVEVGDLDRDGTFDFAVFEGASSGVGFSTRREILCSRPWSSGSSDGVESMMPYRIESSAGTSMTATTEPWVWW